MNAASGRVALYLVLVTAALGCAGPASRTPSAAPIEDRVRSPDVSAGAAVGVPAAPAAAGAAVDDAAVEVPIQIARADEAYRAPPPRNAAVQSLVAAAMQAVGRGELDRAQAALERALKLAPHDSNLWTQLAYTHYRQGTLDRAGEIAQRALSISSARPAEQAAAWRLIADIEAARGNAAEAASAKRKAEHLTP